MQASEVRVGAEQPEPQETKIHGASNPFVVAGEALLVILVGS